MHENAAALDSTFNSRRKREPLSAVGPILLPVGKVNARQTAKWFDPVLPSKVAQCRLGDNHKAVEYNSRLWLYGAKIATEAVKP
jgi:hypothetical protein